MAWGGFSGLREVVLRQRDTVGVGELGGAGEVEVAVIEAGWLGGDSCGGVSAAAIRRAGWAGKCRRSRRARDVV